MRTISMTESCVFLQIGISRMGDKRGVSSEEIDVDADKDLVKVRKVIFRSPHFDKIKSLDSEIRRYVRNLCFPYESGLHLIPKSMMDIVNMQLEAYHNQRYRYILDFAEVWKELRAEFPDKLRKLYNEKDYDVGDVTSQFSMSWQFLKLEVPLDLEQVSSEMYKEHQKRFDSRMQEAYEEARMILRETCLQLVTHLRVSLESDQYGASKRLSTSTVTKLQEFLQMFNLRNVTNDRELETLTSQMKSLLHGVDADCLRTMDGLRHRVRHELATAEEILKEAVLITPTRRIKGV